MSHLSKYLLYYVFGSLLAIPEKSYASDFYFSSSTGNDSYSLDQAQSSSTPWKTIDKLNELLYSLKAGDRIFFRRGDVFHGTIRPTKGGTPDAPILFDAYGSGSMPVITSLVELSSLEHVGSGVYEYRVLNSEATLTKVVLVNDQLTAVGRFPNLDDGNGGYLTIHSVKPDFSIVGSKIPFDAKGGEIVIRKNNWIIDSYLISNSEAGQIDYVNRGTSNYKPIDGYGYFIQNHVATLDQFGEWAFSEGKKILSIFLGERKPSEVKVEISTKDYLLVTDYLVRNLSFSNIHFKGSNRNLINIERSSNISIENCLLEFAGENAVYSYSTPDFTFKNNTISNALSGGIFFWHSTPRAIISDNLIENSMPFQGMAKNSDLNGIGIYIAGNADDSQVLRNRVINSGYNGIHFGGNNSIVKNNLVENYCLWKQDGAGIYMNSDGLINSNNKGREIIGNIVIGGVGAKEGTNQEFDLAEGIYLDDNTEGVCVAQNTVAHVNGKGIYLHNTSNIEIIDNLMFDCSVQLQLTHDNFGRPLRNIKVEGNKFSSINEGEIAFSISSIKNDLDQFGTSGENYFLDPYMNEFIFKSKSPGDPSNGLRKSFKDWSDSFGFERSSRVVALNLDRFKILSKKTLKQSNFNEDINLVSGVYHAVSKKLSSGIEGGTWEINPNETESALAYIQIGSVNEDDRILVEMDVKSLNENTVFEMFLENSFGQDQIEAISYFDASEEIQRVSVFLNSLTSSKNESLVFRIPPDSVSLFIDNLKVSRVVIQNNDDREFFQFNYSPNAVKYPLVGIFKDAKGQLFEDSVTILPYRSALLVRID